MIKDNMIYYKTPKYQPIELTLLTWKTERPAMHRSTMRSILGGLAMLNLLAVLTILYIP